MSTESQTPTCGDGSQDAEALRCAVEAAFGPGAFALISEEEGADREEAGVPELDDPEEVSNQYCDDTATSPDQHGSRKHVVFESAGIQFAVAIENVLEIQQVPPIASLLGVPAWLRGITSLRGAILSVVDVGLFLGLPATEGDGKMVVVRSLADKLTAGLIVEGIVGIRALVRTSITDTGTSEAGDLPFVQGTLAVHDQSYMFLNLEELLLSSEFRQLNAD